jgi:hypothetical protein
MALTFYDGFDHYNDLAEVGQVSDEDNHPLKAILEKFTYKPGWVFIFDEDCQYVYLTIKFDAIDADNPSSDQRITLRAEYTLDKIIFSDYNWTKWLRSQIIKCETHEVDEFFQIDGLKPFDPH